MSYDGARGNSAWDDETQTLLVWNLEDGIDIYHIDNGLNRVGKINMKIHQNMVIQLEFCNHHSYFISGSDHGDVYIWDVNSQRPYQILHHSPGVSGQLCYIQRQNNLLRSHCRANCYRMSTLFDGRVHLIFPQFYACQDGKLMIASASSESDDSQPTICIWSSVSLSFIKLVFQLTCQQCDQFSTKPSKLVNPAAVVPIRTGYVTPVDLKQLWIICISVMAGSLLTILMWYRLFR